MHRPGILERLYLIYENLSFIYKQKAAQKYHGMKKRMDERIKACQECGGAFYSESDSAELTCVDCGRIEILDGTAFAPRIRYNVTRTTKKCTFKYVFNRLNDDCKFLPLETQLSPNQIYEVNRIFEHIEYQLPKKYILSLRYLQNLRKNSKKATTHASKLYNWLPTTFLQHEQRWNNAFRNSGIIL